jgi:hypothetical protein
MMWSCTTIPKGFATSMIDCVIWMSAREGVGSPEGWLCNNLRRELIALNRKRVFGRKLIGGVWDRVLHVLIQRDLHGGERACTLRPF